MENTSASEQIDNIINEYDGWKSQLLTELRAVIHEADAHIVEEIKWRMPTRPQGLPVWSHEGIVCFVEIWKDNIKLLFPNGVELNDPKKLFNARLQSKDIRAVEFKENYILSKTAFVDLIRGAIKFNVSKRNRH